MSWSIGVDVGGTFTDLVAVDPDTNRVVVSKVPTTLSNQADGFLSALEAAGVEPSDVRIIVHGTTTGTNAVLERKGAAAGLLTTKGFRDSLELGRRTRPHLYGLHGTFRPLIERDRRLEVSERMNSLGEIVRELDEAEVRAAVQTLLERGCESVAISFLHSYAAPEHERRTAAIVRELWPNEFVSVGSEVLPEIREFERTTATALNALLQPLISRYITTLLARLEAKGFTSRLLITQANGGVMSAESTGPNAVRTVLSGPAAGVTAAAHIADRAGFRDVISADMGGTSFDVAMIRNAAPDLAFEKDLQYGVPLRIPIVDMATIGAGGGSIAFVDRAGLLHVGPESSGATPGPVCYLRGGDRPTITDANVWLGRLDPQRIPAVTGEWRHAVESVLREQIAEPLAVSIDQAAAAILRVANDAMAGAIRLVSIERGVDPRGFVLIPFGGAGPLHATTLARELAIPRVLVPLRPGLTSALGCVVADVRHDYVRTFRARLDSLDVSRLNSEFAEIEQRGRADIEQERVESVGLHTEFGLDMQYEGQFHVLRVALSGMPDNTAEIQRTFESRYAERYGAHLEGTPIRIANLRVSVVAKRPRLDLASLSLRTTQPRIETSRPVCFDGGWLDTRVIDRLSLETGMSIDGPAILEQEDSTFVLEPGCRAEVDQDRNLLVEVDR